MNKYEQLIEHIINDETDKARELFHTIVVEKSRDIYENLIDEQDLDEVGGNQVEDLVDEITIDEQGMTEEEESEEGSEEGAMDAEEMPGEEEQGEAEIENRVVDLEDALDELKAEFDALMAGEEHEEEMMPGMHGDKDAEEMEGMMMSDMHTGDKGADEMEGMMYEEQSEFFEAKDEDEEDEDDEEKEVVKEYVEKVAAPSNKTEGGEVGKGGSANVNKTSTVAGKNNMGGSAANIATGKANPSPDGTSPKATVKPKAEFKGAGSYENVPGAKAGQAFAKKETAVKTEVGGVNKTSPLAK
jgi:hypothetical protein